MSIGKAALGQSLMFSYCRTILMVMCLLITKANFGFSFENSVQHPISFDDFAYSDLWLNLLYYQKIDVQKRIYAGLIRDPFFYLDPKGADDPRQELITTLAVFRQQWLNADLKNHPQCRFPARFRLLKKYFELYQPTVICPQFTQWGEQYQPDELVLVYASQYLSNPASVFGHSFLVLTSKKQTKGFWFTYNFAADIPQDANGLAYVVGGLAGWYTGEYTVMPYYNRLAQYGNVENRDLWHFTLRLNPEELEFFISHMWELVHTARFQYYFMTDNCAGILLRTLSATLPDFAQSLGHLPVLYVHPMEVVKALDQQNRIKNVELMPSQGNMLRLAIKSMSRKQRDLLFDHIYNVNQDFDLPEDRGMDASVADALIQFISYERQKNFGDLPDQYKKLERQALIYRSRLKDDPEMYTMQSAIKEQSLQSSPLLSHDSSMLSAGIGWVNAAETAILGYRLAVHGLLDRDPGFLDNSSIEILNLKLSISDKNMWFQEINFASIENFQPMWLIDPRPTWRLKLALRENLDTPPLQDHFLQVQSGYGLTVDWANQYFFALLVSNLNLGLGAKLCSDPIEMGVDIGAIFRLSDFKALIKFGMGQGLFSGSQARYQRLIGGLSWNVGQSWSLVQESEWGRYPNKRDQLDAYRFNFGVRYFY